MKKSIYVLLVLCLFNISISVSAKNNDDYLETEASSFSLPSILEEKLYALPEYSPTYGFALMYESFSSYLQIKTIDKKYYLVNLLEYDGIKAKRIEEATVNVIFIGRNRRISKEYTVKVYELEKETINSFNDLLNMKDGDFVDIRATVIYTFVQESQKYASIIKNNDQYILFLDHKEKLNVKDIIIASGVRLSANGLVFIGSSDLRRATANVDSYDYKNMIILEDNIKNINNSSHSMFQMYKVKGIIEEYGNKLIIRDKVCKDNFVYIKNNISYDLVGKEVSLNLNVLFKEGPFYNVLVDSKSIKEENIEVQTKDKIEVLVEYLKKYNNTQINKDISLPKIIDDINITYKSSNPNVFSNDGIIKIKEGIEKVILNIKLNNEKETKDLNIVLYIEAK